MLNTELTKFLIEIMALLILWGNKGVATKLSNYYHVAIPTATPTATTTPRPSATPRPTGTPKPSTTPKPSVTPTPVATGMLNVYVTWYGWPDNDPAGTAIAYPHSEYPASLHEGASGIGTWDNPITFATKKGRFSIGTKLYVPSLKKYIILEDTCASCTTNWIDIWMNSVAGNTNKVIACEEYWTKDDVVELNPPADREVDIVPMYDTVTNICRN